MPARKLKTAAKKPEGSGEDKMLFNSLLVILAIIIVFFVYAVSIGRAPQAYTQVWLANGNPASVKADESFSAGFVIENDEGKAMEYSYAISAEGTQKALGKITLEKGKQRLVSESVSFSGPHAEKQKILIEVRKPGRSEPYTLWFWVSVE